MLSSTMNMSFAKSKVVVSAARCLQVVLALAQNEPSPSTDQPPITANCTTTVSTNLTSRYMPVENGPRVLMCSSTSVSSWPLSFQLSFTQEAMTQTLLYGTLKRKKSSTPAAWSQVTQLR